MFGKKKRTPQPKGLGAAAAKQMGLLVDFNPEEMMQDMDDQTAGDADLEAELSALTGGRPAGGGAKPKGKAPLPMEDIARMAEECMKEEDDDEEDDESLEHDEDLLAELQEVVGGEETEDNAMTDTSTSTPSETPHSTPQVSRAPAAVPGSLQHTVEERLAMYRTAAALAKTSGESSKARRYDRGLKTLEAMLVSLKNGRKVDEADIPPPVATGAPPTAPMTSPTTAPPTAPTAPPRRPPPPPPPRPTTAQAEHAQTPPDQQGEPEAAPVETDVSPEAALPGSAEVSSQPISDREEAGHANTGGATKAMLCDRQREYKMAAIKAKQQGDLEQAKLYYRSSKKFDTAMEALETGHEVDLSSLPPPLSAGVVSASSDPERDPVPGPTVSPGRPASSPPGPASSAAPAPPSQPRDVLEALEQRRDRYQEACAQAKASGDERKARMHERIAKQYQSAIRAHKAGRPVNYEELPVPPGFPPIPGQEGAGAEQGFAVVLEAANKLATEEPVEPGDEDGENEESRPAVPEKLKKPVLAVPPMTQGPKKSPSLSPDKTKQREGVSAAALQQLDFMEGRRSQYMKAALQAKQKNDLDTARTMLRTAKGLETLIEAAKAGKHVDISKVPSPPGDEDEDFILVHHSDVQVSERGEQVYSQLAKILKEQYEKCMNFSKQFTHLGNITETTKFEKMAESCKKSLEILKLSQSKGLEPPKHHFEERTYHTVRIFPDLSSTEMVVVIVKGMNLPAPSGVATNDLDAYVKFDFPYPSTEQAQKHRTQVIKNSNSPEFNQNFTLSINRNHRGFRRLIQSKGIKLELLHKGGFLRSDKPIGTAQIKLEKLEKESEVREIVEVMDGRKPTGGRVEVRVRLREPLSGQDLQNTTERWLVLDQII
ncbi:coiled-coil and C2 domain-containing protein 1B isoform X2 [Esox lucius]|uniref:coiled-coil and C2 domain-containing protein 1B isoform X2 n=1 Tax=Esox lucius TaxID=8010 RepID=UPI001476EFE6|nr:coiled-coil and C2 domain-containing protein 1B isoform X2 [Esox lucius]